MIRLSSYKGELLIGMFCLMFMASFITSIYIGYSKEIVSPIIVSLIFGVFFTGASLFLRRVNKVIFINPANKILVVRNLFSKTNVKTLERFQINDVKVNYWTRRIDVYVKDDKNYITYLGVGKKSMLKKFLDS